MSEYDRTYVKVEKNYLLRPISSEPAEAILIDRVPLRIGRHPENDLIIRNQSVSKHHAEIYLDNETFMVKDLNSKNRTYVNGAMIDKSYIKHGDCIRFGNLMYLFQKYMDREADRKFTSDEFEKKITGLKKICLMEPEQEAEGQDLFDSHTIVTKDKNISINEIALSEIKELERMYLQLGTLLNISNYLTRFLEIDELLDSIINQLRTVIPAEKIVILLKKNGEFQKRIESGNIDTVGDASSTIIEKVISTREYVTYGNALENVELKDAASIQEQHIRSILCVPISSDEELLGLIYLDNSSICHSFDENDAKFLIAVAGQAGIAFQNALLLEKIKKNHEKVLEIERLAAIGTFAAEISHQMKNSLVPLQRLKKLRSLIEDNQEAVSLLDSLSRSAEKFEEINRSIRRLASPVKISPGWEDLSMLIRQALFNCSEKIKSKNISVEKDIPEYTQIFVDRVQLVQALSNIIINAAEAVGDSGGKITIEAVGDPEHLTISVKDNGIGIPEEKMSQIFDIFYTTKDKSGGNGLGLPLFRAVILAHNGRVEVKSKVGKGTEFLIHFPVSIYKQSEMKSGQAMV